MGCACAPLSTARIEQKDATFVVVLIIKIYIRQKGKKQKTFRRIYAKYAFQEYIYA